MRDKSWRDIDRARDKSSYKKTSQRKSLLERHLEDPIKKKIYLQEVEKLFMGKKGTPAHEKDLHELHEAYGKPDFDKKVKKYVEKYGLPDDWSDLMLLLDVKDYPDIVIESLNAIKELLPQKGLLEKTGLKSKLKVLEMTHTEPRVRETIKEFLCHV